MFLTLEVVGQKAAQMGAAARKVFCGGGTIGRWRDNDWVLPDMYVSPHHATIVFADGNFMIEDTSTNGVFINSPQNLMTRGKPYTLRSGDTVYIDNYEIRVTLSAEPLVAAPSAAAKVPVIPSDPFGDDCAEAGAEPSETDWGDTSEPHRWHFATTRLAGDKLIPTDFGSFAAKYAPPGPPPLGVAVPALPPSPSPPRPRLAVPALPPSPTVGPVRPQQSIVNPESDDKISGNDD
jgi:type VI secretion system FHA domain protein